MAFRLQRPKQSGNRFIDHGGGPTKPDSPSSCKGLPRTRQYAGEELSSPPDSGSRGNLSGNPGVMHQEHGQQPATCSCCAKRLHLGMMDGSLKPTPKLQQLRLTNVPSPRKWWDVAHAIA